MEHPDEEPVTSREAKLTRTETKYAHFFHEFIFCFEKLAHISIAYAFMQKIRNKNIQLI